MKTTSLIVALFVAGLVLAGCERDGPFEDAGEEIDDAVNDVEESIEDAADEVEDNTANI